MPVDIQSHLNNYNKSVEQLKSAQAHQSACAHRLADAMATNEFTEPNEPAPRKKRKSRSDTAELKVPSKYIDRVPKSSGCLCGCGEEPTANSQFIRGHAHTLSAIVKFVEAEKLPWESIPTHAHGYLYGHDKVSKDMRARLNYVEDAAE